MIQIVKVPLYKCQAAIMIESSLDEWKKFYAVQSKEGLLTSSNDASVEEEFENKTPGFVFATGLNTYVCYISDKEDKGLVAHELFHLANAILQDKCFIMDANCEAWAYLIEFLTNEYYYTVENFEQEKDE